MDGLSCLIDRSRTRCTADGHEVRQSAADRRSLLDRPRLVPPWPLCPFASLTRVFLPQGKRIWKSEVTSRSVWLGQADEEKSGGPRCGR